MLKDADSTTQARKVVVRGPEILEEKAMAKGKAKEKKVEKEKAKAKGVKEETGPRIGRS